MSLTGTLFMVSFLAGCGAALAKRPIYGLVMYVIVFYVHPPARWWGEGLPDLRWSLSAAAVTLVAIVIHSPKDEIRLFRQGGMIWFLLFLIWIFLQSLWTINPDMHSDLVNYMTKYVFVLVMIYKCIQNEDDLKAFLWSHVVGCAYLGWLAFESYQGGRFEGFGSPGIGDANAAAVQIVTGIFVAAGLILGPGIGKRSALVVLIAFILNALVTTISRSGFLAAGSAGVIFNLFTPPHLKKRVLTFSILGGILFLMLTGPAYWERMSSLKYAGEDVEGVDTGGGRLVIMQAQLEMFTQHPMGCGHRCTATLSPHYLSSEYLTGHDEEGARSSHSTYLTVLLEQGIPGAIIYCMLLLWIYRNIVRLKRQLYVTGGFLAEILPSVVSIIGAIAISDIFVDNLKAEVRIWFIGVLMVLVKLAQQTVVEKTAPQETPKLDQRQ